MSKLRSSSRISRAGVYLKPLLIQCALASLRKGEKSPFRARYERIKRRRGHKRALIAIGRMMLTASGYQVTGLEAPVSCTTT